MPCIHTDCNNINEFGQCRLTACTNPKYNGSGTYTITTDVVPRAEYEKVKAENEELKRRLERVIKDNCEDICKHCKNQIECKSKECEAYVSGVGDIDGKYPTMKWSCEDFDFGTCPMMEKTPCNGCVDNDYCGFKLRDAQGED